METKFNVYRYRLRHSGHNNEIERLVSTFRWDYIDLAQFMANRLFHSRKRWKIEGLGKGKIHNLATISSFEFSYIYLRGTGCPGSRKLGYLQSDLQLPASLVLSL